jgi:hypothetical protein
MEKSNFGNPDLIKEQHKLSRNTELDEKYGEIEKEYTIRLEYTITVEENKEDVLKVIALTEEDALEKARDIIWKGADDIDVGDEEILAVAIPAERDTLTLDMFSK